MTQTANLTTSAAPRGLSVMTQHGDVIREPTPRGNVFLSRLRAGRSRIVALAPSVRFVVQGEEFYSIDGRMRRVRAGEFILVEAGTHSDARIAGSSETIGLCIYLPATPKGLIQDDVASVVVQGGRGDPLSEMLRDVAGRAMRGAPIDPGRLAEATADGAEQFLAHFNEGRDRLSHQRPAARTEVMHRLERARALIHANAGQPLTLEEIGREAALSRFYLTRLFSEVYGLPPVAYHRQLRLEHAAMRLRLNMATPTVLAEDLGYNSLSAFSRAYRAHFGFPPSVTDRP